MTEATNAIPESDADIERLAEGSRFFNFRHSKAIYKEYEKKLASDNPQSKIDIEAQESDDITPEGHDFARKQAHAFLDLMDPHKDIFYIVSSNQTRAIQTADIYARVAMERGFNVVRHKKTGTELADKIGEGYVRAIDSLSLNFQHPLEDAVFNPEAFLPKINWAAVDPSVKAKWEQAHQIVLANDNGSWGANFFEHAEEIKKIFPYMKSAQDLYEGQYKNMLRLVDFAKKKAGNERINVLSFGHENYMGAPLQEATGNHALGNCEGVELRDGKLVRIVLEPK